MARKGCTVKTTRIVRTDHVGSKREWVLRARVWSRGHALFDGHVFANEAEARAWVAQPYVAESYYLVTAIVVRSGCCGAVVALGEVQRVEDEPDTRQVHSG